MVGLGGDHPGLQNAVDGFHVRFQHDLIIRIDCHADGSASLLPLRLLATANATADALPPSICPPHRFYHVIQEILGQLPGVWLGVFCKVELS